MEENDGVRSKRVVLRNECRTNLQYYRKMNGLTQQELADLANVNLRTLQGYEQGRKKIDKAGSATVSRLADVLNVQVQDILEHEADLSF